MKIKKMDKIHKFLEIRSDKIGICGLELITYSAQSVPLHAPHWKSGPDGSRFTTVDLDKSVQP